MLEKEDQLDQLCRATRYAKSALSPSLTLVEAYFMGKEEGMNEATRNWKEIVDKIFEVINGHTKACYGSMQKEAAEKNKI